MQATQISASQLMMSFLSKAKKEIGEGILTNEFSKELQKQCGCCEGNSTLRVPVQGEKLSVPEKTTLKSSKTETPPASTEKGKPQEAAKASAVSRQNVPATVGKTISETKTREQLVVLNSVAVEKILANFQLPAEARKSCLSSVNAEGGVPFNALVGILDAYGQKTKDSINENKASAQDVAELVGSLQLMQGMPPETIERIQLKPKGFYTVKEFKGLLNRIVECVNDAVLKKAPLQEQAHTNGHTASAQESVKGGMAPVVSKQESRRLLRSGLPSFAIPDFRKTHSDLWTNIDKPIAAESLHEPTLGDSGKSKKAERDLHVSVAADAELNTPVKEPGTALLFTGFGEDTSDSATFETTCLTEKDSDEIFETNALPVSGMEKENSPYVTAGQGNIRSEKPQKVRISDIQETVEKLADGGGDGFAIRQYGGGKSSSTDSFQERDDILFSSPKSFLEAGEILEGRSSALGQEEAPDQSFKKEIPIVKASEIPIGDPDQFLEGLDRVIQKAEREEPGHSGADGDVPHESILEKADPATTVLVKKDSSNLEGHGVSILEKFPEADSKDRQVSGKDAPRGKVSGAGAEDPEGLEAKDARNTPQVPFDARPANSDQGRGISEKDRCGPGERRGDPVLEEDRDDLGVDATDLGSAFSPSVTGRSVSSGEPARAPEAVLSLQDDSWAGDLSRRLVELHEKERNQLTLELAPKHLGKLVLQVETKHDQVIAWLSTENEQAKNLLMQNVSLLRQQLQDQGLILSQLHVDVRQEGQEKNSHRNFEQFSVKGGRSKVLERLNGLRLSTAGSAYKSENDNRRISFFA